MRRRQVRRRLRVGAAIEWTVWAVWPWRLTERSVAARIRPEGSPRAARIVSQSEWPWRVTVSRLDYMPEPGAWRNDVKRTRRRQHHSFERGEVPNVLRPQPFSKHCDEL